MAIFDKRNFDNWNSYLDNDGNVLHGKIRFCSKGTTDNVVIYNSDAIPVRNPEFTDMLGRTEYQVFVDTADNITAYFYKYVGTGDMMTTDPDDYDPSRWALQYTSDDIDPAQTVDLTSTTADGVSTMQGLRSKDPDDVPSVDGAKMLWLYGYYEAGDTSPVLYVWDSASSANDDGGSVIQSNEVPGPGRWKLATRELHFDVRHFGVFPTDDIYSTDYQYTSQLANCAAYIDAEGLDAWFPALNDNLSYYLFNGANTFSIHGDIYVSDPVRMHCKSGTSGTAIQCHEIHKTSPYLFVSTQQTGLATLTADWINISWVGGQVTGNARVGWVIDTSSFARIITGKEVKFVTNGSSSLQLDNCQITSNKQITGEIYIKDSIIKSEYFADGYDWSDLTSVGNTILLDNCGSADIYVSLKNKQGEVDYGDLGEQTVTGATFGDGAIVENANLVNCTFSGDCDLANVSGSVVLPAAKVHNCVDCWLTVANDTTAVIGSLMLNRGSITGADLQVLTLLRLDNVTLNSEVSVTGGSIECRNVIINEDISHVASDTINEVFDDCVFNAQLSIAGGDPDTVVKARWYNNLGTVLTPIVLDRTNLKANDLLHQYTYANNSGTFINTSSVTLTFRSMANYTPGATNKITQPNGTPGAMYGYTLTVSSAGGYVEDPDKYVCKVKLFTVGTTYVRKQLMIEPSKSVILEGGSNSHPAGSIMYVTDYDQTPDPSQESITPTLLFDSDYVWKLRAVTIPGMNYPVDNTDFPIVFKELQ